jgi:predicted TIM-barrel fold metal-dependent hydrolase
MGEPEARPPIIDFHLHAKRKGRPVLDEILQEMDREGVAQAVLLGRDTDPRDLDDPAKRARVLTGLLASPSAPRGADDLAAVLTRIRGELSRTITNTETARYVAAHPRRFIGVGSINLSKSAAYVAAKLEEVFALRLTGMKFYPPTQFFNPAGNENLRFICQRLRKRRKLLVFHTGVMPGVWEDPLLSQDANPRHLAPVVDEFDEVPFVLAHFGAYSGTRPGIWFDEALALGARYRNVWYDLSAVPYVVTERRMIERARSTVGTDRILFGSDYLDYMGFTLEAVRGTPFLSEDEKRGILGGNARRLLRRVDP